MYVKKKTVHIRKVIHIISIRRKCTMSEILSPERNMKLITSKINCGFLVLFKVPFNFNRMNVPSTNKIKEQHSKFLLEQ